MLKFLGFGVRKMGIVLLGGKSVVRFAQKITLLHRCFCLANLLQRLLPTYLCLRYATNYELQKYSPNVDWDSNLHLRRDV